MIDISNEAKQEFLRDGSKKYIKVSFPNGEHRDLGNADIVGESLTFDENLCQQDEFKFGLCESNHISFRTGAIEENIKGKEIEVSLSVLSGKGDKIEGYIQEFHPDDYGIWFSPVMKGSSDVTNPISMSFRVYFSEFTPYTGTSDYIVASLSLLGKNINEEESGLISTTTPYERNKTYEYLDFRLYWDGTVDDFDRMDVRADSNFKIASIHRLYETVPLGRFTIDSCKKDQFGVRSIEAYTNKFENSAKAVTQFEKWKRSWYSTPNQAYQVDSKKYLYQERKASPLLNRTLATVEPSERRNSFAGKYTNGRYSEFTVYYKNFLLMTQDILDAIYSVTYNKTEKYDYLTNLINENIVAQTTRKYKDQNITKVGFTHQLEYVPNGYRSVCGKYESYTMGGIVFETVLPDYYGETDTLYYFGNDCNDGTTYKNVITIMIPYAVDGLTGYTEYFIDPDSIKLYKYDIPASGVNISIPRNATKSVKFSGISSTSTRTVAIINGESLKTEFNPYSYLELSGKFGRINRDGGFEEFTLGIDTTLFPNTDLYPSNSLYPDIGDSGYTQIYRNNLQSLYIEEEESEPANDKQWIGTILFDYLDSTTNQTQVGKIVLSDYADGTYYIENNDILVKTPRSLANATALVNNNFVANATKVFPWKRLDANIKGMPWLEAGDVISLPDGSNQAVTFIYNRSLKGIIALRDSISAEVDFGDFTNVLVEGE